MSDVDNLPVEKECCTCRYFLLYGDQDPCKSCKCHANWESVVPESRCDETKHDTCDLLILFANGNVMEIPDVSDYQYVEKSGQFRFEKDGWINFIPEQNVSYFGRCYEKMEMEIDFELDEPKSVKGD